MINAVVNPTPSAPTGSYQSKRPRKPCDHTVSTPPGEESGAPRWSRVEPSVGQSGAPGGAERAPRQGRAEPQVEQSDAGRLAPAGPRS
jgi:hypothetical protein